MIAVSFVVLIRTRVEADGDRRNVRASAAIAGATQITNTTRCATSGTSTDDRRAPLSTGYEHMMTVANVAFGLVLGSLAVAALHPRFEIPTRPYHRVLFGITLIGYVALIVAR